MGRRITNIEFYPGLLAMITWAFVIGVTHMVVFRFRLIGNYLLVPFVTVITFVWAHRVCRTYGRATSRSRHEDLDLFVFVPKGEDPPTQVERTREEAEEEKRIYQDLLKEFLEPYEEKPSASTSSSPSSSEEILKPLKVTKKTSKRAVKKRKQEHYANEFARAMELQRQEKSSPTSSPSSQDKKQHYEKMYPLVRKEDVCPESSETLIDYLNQTPTTPSPATPPPASPPPEKNEKKKG